MSLRKKRFWFTISTSVVLIVLFSVVTIQSFSYFSQDTIREQARMAAEMLRISLTEQMRTGVITERETLFKRLRTIPGLVDVRVVRGEPVIQQFGPGIDGEKFVLCRVDGIEVYVPSGIDVEAVRDALRELGLVA